jgi:anti-sigma regulatory factor (Ser/Thr protein kinase)
VVTSERLTFTCTPGTASRARRLIKNFGAARLTEQRISELEAAVGEALANSVEHGQATEIEVCCTFEATSFVVELSDNGQGFDHPKSADAQTAALAPARRRGYGFQIMRGLADEVRYSDGGRRIVLKKRFG